MNPVQLGIFLIVVLIVGLMTWWQCREPGKKRADTSREYFLASGGLTWIFVAGSITITNLGTEQLVGMNGNQMALLALWEISDMVGLLFKGVDAKAAIAEVIFGIALMPSSPSSMHPLACTTSISCSLRCGQRSALPSA